MKIAPIVKNIKSDMTATKIRIISAGANGYGVADRTAKIYNQNKFTRNINIMRSVGDKIIKISTINELPYIAGAIGLLIPMPFSSPILMGLGFLAKFVVQSFKSNKPKI